MANSSPDHAAAYTRSLHSHLFALPGLRDRPFSEALFTTFNVDLGFVEQRVLGLARASGAAVTVLADASVYDPDPRAVRSAGASYLVGVVDMPAAFHPKVTVLVGPERALVAVGSGNLTSGGWAGNDETLLVADASVTNGVPAIVGQVAQWLRTLEDLRMSATARTAVVRTRTALERLLAAGDTVDTGHRLVTTSVGRLLDQLPAEPAHTLRLYAPFHDHTGAALAALLRRYRPARVEIAVQRGKTVIDTDPLQAAAAAEGTELVWHDAGSRYRHGKLVEALTTNGGWVLTGSPNLTGAALLRGMRSGGNCEVGVLTESTASLYPGEGGPLDPEVIPTVKIAVAPGERPSTAATRPVLLGATLHDDGIHVELAQPEPAPVDVELSRFTDLPETVEPVGQIPADTTTAVIKLSHPAASRSRVRLAYDVDGQRRYGPFHFLASSQQVLHRIEGQHGRAANTDVDWAALFGDDTLLREWTRTLDRVTREQHGTPSAAPFRNAPVRVGASPAHAKLFDDEEAWARYSQDAVARLGPTIAHHASGGLILPHLGSETTVTAGTPRWQDKFDADQSEFDEEQTADNLDQDVDDPQDPPAPDSVTTISNAHRQRLRAWMNGLADEAAHRPAIDRIAFARLALIGSLVPIWTDDQAGWFPILTALARSLTLEDVPTALIPEAASIAAVILYRLDQSATPDRRTGTGHEYATLADELLPMASQADPDRTESIARGLYGEDNAKAMAQAIIDHLHASTRKNPWPELVRLIIAEHPSWYVELLHDRHIYVETKGGNELALAGKVMEQVPTGLTVAVHVVSGIHGREKVVVRHENVLVVQEEHGFGTKHGRTIWKTYRLGGTASPATIAASEGTAQRTRIDQPPWLRPSKIALEALSAAGISLDVHNAPQ